MIRSQRQCSALFRLSPEKLGLPDISNNVGPVKSFLSRLLRSLRRVGLPCSLLTSASTTTARFVIFRSASVRPKHLFDPYFDHDYFSNSLCREWDAHSLAQASTSHHVRYRAVPRANRTQTTANTHNHSATSSTSELQDAVPSLPWQYLCDDASPGACTDVATPNCFVLPPGRPPPTRSATRNCLAW